jgi:hypothetical protein
MLHDTAQWHWRNSLGGPIVELAWSLEAPAAWSRKASRLDVEH